MPHARFDLFLDKEWPVQATVKQVSSSSWLAIETGSEREPVVTIFMTPAQALDLGEQIVRSALAVLTPHEFSAEYLASLRREADRAEQPAEVSSREATDRG